MSDNDLSASVVDECWGTVHANFIIDSHSSIICKWDIKVMLIYDDNHYMENGGKRYSHLCIDNLPKYAPLQMEQEEGIVQRDNPFCLVNLDGKGMILYR